MHGTFKRKPPTGLRSARPTVEAVPWYVWLELCLTRWRERRRLQELNDDQLKDIGLSRADVERECRRWPWDGHPRDV